MRGFRRIDKIAALASRPGVKRVAVENFLWTVYGSDKYAAARNLRADARAYGWDDETIAAISDGLDDVDILPPMQRR